MATAPITSTAARDIAFTNKNQDIKSFTPKSKANEFEASKTKIEVDKTSDLKSANDIQEKSQTAKPNEEVKPAPFVNTRGEVTGSTINTSV